MCEPETYLSLLRDPSHWAFELTLEFLSGLVGVAVWPLVKKVWKRYFHRHDPCCVQPVLKCEGCVLESNCPGFNHCPFMPQTKTGTESPGPF
jgi:hypothetical protein